MSRPRFLVDHDFSQLIVDGALRQEPAIDFVLAREAGLDRALDPALLDHAAAEGLIVLSHDSNTMTAAAVAAVTAGRPMARLIIAHQRAPIGRVIDSLVLLWAASEAEEYRDRIKFLPL
jgi:hypothetical protein